MKRPLFVSDDVEYYLIQKTPKKGKPVYHVRWRDGDKVRQKSTKQTNQALAHKTVKQMIDNGEIGLEPTGMRSYLVGFWTEGKSEYLRTQRARHDGKPLSRVYVDANRSAIERYFLPYFHEREIHELHELNRENLQGWQNWLRLDKGVSPRTCNRVRGAVWTALKWALEHDLIRRHPGSGVKPLPEKTPERRIFEREEIAKLYGVEWMDIRAKAAFALSECTGMRLGEIRGLRVQNLHVETDRPYVDVVENYVPVDGQKEPKLHPDGRRGIEILNPMAVPVLQELLSRNRWGAMPTNYVFFDIDNAEIPVGRDPIVNGLEKAMVAAEIEPDGRTFHCLRHSAVSHYGTLMSPAQRLRYFGHSSVEMSLRYSHETEADAKRLRKQAAQIIPINRKAQ